MLLVGLASFHDIHFLPPLNPPSGHFRFRYFRRLAILESPLARCRAPIVSTKALLAGGATNAVAARWAGAIFPSIFGQAGRVLAALYVPKFTVSELGVKNANF